MGLDHFFLGGPFFLFFPPGYIKSAVVLRIGQVIEEANHHGRGIEMLKWTRRIGSQQKNANV